MPNLMERLIEHLTSADQTCEIELDLDEYAQLIDYLQRLDVVSEKINRLEEEHCRNLEALEGQRCDIVHIVETAWRAAYRRAQLEGRLPEGHIPQMMERGIQSVWMLPDGKKAVWLQRPIPQSEDDSRNKE